MQGDEFGKVHNDHIFRDHRMILVQTGKSLIWQIIEWLSLVIIVETLSYLIIVGSG